MIAQRINTTQIPSTFCTIAVNKTERNTSSSFNWCDANAHNSLKLSMRITTFHFQCVFIKLSMHSFRAYFRVWLDFDYRELDVLNAAMDICLENFTCCERKKLKRSTSKIEDFDLLIVKAPICLRSIGPWVDIQIVFEWAYWLLRQRVQIPNWNFIICTNT